MSPPGAGMSPDPRPAGLDTLDEAERNRDTLALGILVFRWAGLAWMAVLLSVITGELRQPVAAWVAVGVAAVWTGWLTRARPVWSEPLLAADLALAVALVVLQGVVNQPEALTAGDRAAWVTVYPVAAALTWGATRGLRRGTLAGVVLGAALTGSRVANQIDLGQAAHLLSVAGGITNFVLAGAAVGLVARMLARSAKSVRQAREDSARERERAGRLAEREVLARQIHDSVLQSLTLVHKQGRELAARGAVPGAEVLRLAELAGAQEQVIRALIVRSVDQPEPPPSGEVSLRAALEGLTGVPGVPLSVGVVGPLWLPAACAEELRAAARQALENVARHARATQAWVFAEEEDGEVVVTVRDDGAGFVYDEAALRSAGKLGMLKSMKGRVEQLGGRMKVTTTPGRGTQIELRVPLERVDQDREASDA